MNRGGDAPLPEVPLASFMARVDEVGDCLIWRGYALDGEHPQWRVQGRLWNARRLVWLLLRGTVEEGFQIGVSCGSKACVHPDHLVARTRSMATRGKPKSVVHRVHMALANRARAKLTPEVVLAIRASSQPCIEIDRQIGMSRGYASKIRMGEVWRHHGGHFTGLGEHGAP